MNQYLSIAVLILGLGSARQATSDSLIQPFTRQAPDDEAPLLSATAPGSERFFAVGLLASTVGGGGSCTATLIASSVHPDPEHAALIITAGHCVDLSGDNEVLIDTPMQIGEGWQFIPKYFHDNPAEHHAYPVDRVVYSTMKSQDIAVVRLQATYGELQKNGISPLTIKQFPASGGPVELAHIPAGINVAPYFYLRYTECAALTSRRTLETADWARSDLPWLWSQAVPATGCKSVYSGASGAPFFEKDGTAVIGVLSTSVRADGAGCGDSRPCEITAALPVSREGAAYFAPADMIVAALTENDTLDTGKLDNGKGIALERRAAWSARSQLKDKPDLLIKPVPWAMHIEGDFDQIRYKSGLSHLTRCEDPEGYSAPVPIAGQPLQELKMPTAEGLYTLCAVGKPAGATVWQSFDHATVKSRLINNTPPPPPAVSVEQTVQFWNVTVRPKTNLHRTAFVKYGPVGATDCTSGAGWRVNGDWVQLSIAQAPWRFCTYADDDAGNRSAILQQDYRKPGVN